MQVCWDAMDANRGDYQNGWDTDQFPNNINELTEAMLIFLEAGGLQGGGINFDAKIRRYSTDPADLFYAHIGGMDTFARALITADKILNKSDYKKFRKERYASFDSGKGKEFEEGKLSLEDLQLMPLKMANLKQEAEDRNILKILSTGLYSITNDYSAVKLICRTAGLINPEIIFRDSRFL